MASATVAFMPSTACCGPISGPRSINQSEHPLQHASKYYSSELEDRCCLIRIIHPSSWDSIIATWLEIFLRSFEYRLFLVLAGMSVQMHVYGFVFCIPMSRQYIKEHTLRCEDGVQMALNAEFSHEISRVTPDVEFLTNCVQVYIYTIDRVQSGRCQIVALSNHTL